MTANGGVYSFGTAAFHDSIPGLPAVEQPATPTVAMVAVPGGGGYWLVTSGGDVYCFGKAPLFGSLGGRSLNAPIVAMAAPPHGHGYWLIGADGGVFAFGSAVFHGSVPGLPTTERPDAPVAGIATTPDGGGYWLVTTTGDVYSFGIAPFFGSMFDQLSVGSPGGTQANGPVTGIAPDRATGGYWLVTQGGAVYGFHAPLLGSMGGTPLAAPAIGIISTPGGHGYWLIGADGGVFSFGSATFEGSLGGTGVGSSVIGMAGT